jgi:hypothetical protein
MFAKIVTLNVKVVLAHLLLNVMNVLLELIFHYKNIFLKILVFLHALLELLLILLIKDVTLAWRAILVLQMLQIVFLVGKVLH